MVLWHAVGAVYGGSAGAADQRGRGGAVHDQHHVLIILRHVCWYTPPPPWPTSTAVGVVSQTKWSPPPFPFGAQVAAGRVTGHRESQPPRLPQPTEEDCLETHSSWRKGPGLHDTVIVFVCRPTLCDPLWVRQPSEEPDVTLDALRISNGRQDFPVEVVPACSSRLSGPESPQLPLIVSSQIRRGRQ